MVTPTETLLPPIESIAILAMGIIAMFGPMMLVFVLKEAEYLVNWSIVSRLFAAGVITVLSVLAFTSIFIAVWSGEHLDRQRKIGTPQTETRSYILDLFAEYEQQQDVQPVIQQQVFTVRREGPASE